VLGLALLITLFVRADYVAMLHIAGLAGWNLLWLIPYRGVYFLLYSIGWLRLLHPYDPERRAGLGYVFWVTTVREAIDRLLPVASIGGGIAGVRLMRWRGLPTVGVSASVIVEILLTLVAMYLFTVLGLSLLLGFSASGAQYHRVLPVLLFSLPIPLLTGLLLRYGAVFERIEGFFRPWVGVSAMSEGAVALDHQLRACLRRTGSLLFAGTLQLIALIAGSLEIWFLLRLFGHPISVRAAVIMESLMQALRHLAFFVPAGLGVQEAALVLFGHALGVSSELALAVSLAKRIRELLCGLPSLASWQFFEARRLRMSLPRAF
jgi:putative membrane protein